ncbi:MAG TPA: response regulator [Terriglobales bacterium]|nr:response regulator [Terriglobales bacterium]
MSSTPKEIILVWDDDPSGAPIRIAVLEHSGYQVLSAFDAADVKAALSARNDIRAIIVATSKTVEKTYETCAEIKAAGGPPIMLLGHSNWHPNWGRKFFDVHVQKLDGPPHWTRELRHMIENHAAYLRASSRNILNVDDNEVQRYAVSRILQNGGYKVMEAGTGRQTIELAARKPDLILLDINLPDMSGFDVCRVLKTNPKTSTIPVVHLSATFTKPEARDRGLKNGADEYLFQPIGPEKLLKTLDSVLERPRA